MALQFAITSSGTMVMQSSINIYGSTAVTGFTSAGKVVNLMTAGMPSIGQTIAAYAGQNYGNRDLGRVHQGTKDALKLSCIYSIITGFLSVVLMPVIVGFFFDSTVNVASYMPYARAYIMECVPFYIPLSMIFIYRNTMQACGYGKTALILGFVELISRLITAFVSIKMHSYELAVGGDAAAWLITGIISYILYLTILKKLKASSLVDN